MMTIVSDGTTVAADGMVQCSGTTIELDCRKLIRVDGKLFGAAGWHGALEPVAKWIAEGASPDKVPKIDEFTVVHFCKDIARVYRNDLPYPDPYQYPCAFGSGQPYALAAMACGTTPAGAVQIAMELDPGTGGQILIEEIT